MSKGKYNKLARRIIVVSKLGISLKRLGIVDSLPNEKLSNIYITIPKYFGTDVVRRFVEDNFNKEDNEG